MKLIFSSISRLIFSYSKFLASLIFISTLGTLAHSSEAPTYLKCNDQYFKLTGTFLESNYNVRTKKFKISNYIRKYNENYIATNYVFINRNTGEYKVSKQVICIMKKITFNELPKLDEDGKLF